MATHHWVVSVWWAFNLYYILSISGVLNLLVLAYPQIKIVLHCVPPNQNCIPFAYPQIKNFTQISFIWVRFFKFCVPLWAPPIPPVAPSCTPRGTRTPYLFDWIFTCWAGVIFLEINIIERKFSFNDIFRQKFKQTFIYHFWTKM